MAGSQLHLPSCDQQSWTAQQHLLHWPAVPSMSCHLVIRLGNFAQTRFFILLFWIGCILVHLERSRRQAGSKSNVASNLPMASNTMQWMALTNRIFRYFSWFGYRSQLLHARKKKQTVTLKTCQFCGAPVLTHTHVDHVARHAHSVHCCWT